MGISILKPATTLAQVLRRAPPAARALQFNGEWLAYGDLDYYSSPQFKDKYAKENLNQLNTGEKVLIITEKRRDPDITGTDQFTPTQQQKVAFDELLRQMPIIDHWKLYLLHRDELEKLRRSM